MCFFVGVLILLFALVGYTTFSVRVFMVAGPPPYAGRLAALAALLDSKELTFGGSRWSLHPDGTTTILEGSPDAGFVRWEMDERPWHDVLHMYTGGPGCHVQLIYPKTTDIHIVSYYFSMLPLSGESGHFDRAASAQHTHLHGKVRHDLFGGIMEYDLITLDMGDACPAALYRAK